MATAEQIANRKQVLEFIETYPQFHHQSSFVCGTKACIAGTAILFDRLKTAQALVEQLSAGTAEEFLYRGALGTAPYEFEEGCKLLGLSWGAGMDLFYEWDDDHAVDALRELANEYPTED